MGVIYKITSPTGKLYVGKTYDLRKRINCHKCAAKKGSNIILHNSIAKYGWEKHRLEVIEEVEDDQLDEREMFWIAELNTYCYHNPMGMNMTLGGDGQRSTWMHKTELRQWFSDRFKGEGNPFHGKTHNEETRKLLSKKTSAWNRANGRRVPEWGAEKGRQVVRKPIVVYNNSGEKLAEYISLTEAATQLGLPISAVKTSLMRGNWVRGAYLFKYKSDNPPEKVVVGKINKQNVKRPVLYFLDNLMFEYPSAAEAAQELGVPKTTINRAACYNNLKPIRSGHVFIYKDLFEKV
jgi:group I intron endonuclease